MKVWWCVTRVTRWQFKVCCFMTVHGDDCWLAVVLDGILLWGAFCDKIRAIVWWLQWFPNGITPDKYM